jgi:hypothetical protein
MTRSRNVARAVASALLAGSLLGCGENPAQPTPAPERQHDLEALRQVTRPYTDFDAAQSAGYTERLTDCMSDATGGMGYHYGKTSFIDAEAQVREPEILMYEPQRDGSLQLVGVEYVVPLGARPDPPSLFSLRFHRNEALQLWVLHVLLYRDNPSGMFADWNPTVSCAAAR